ncbi:radical SAM/SPASM domain-containing protein [Desulfosporosinus fructosivorans]
MKNLQSKISKGPYQNLQSKILIGPFQIALDVTNECNMRCLHCYNASGENIVKENELSNTEFIDLIKDISELKPFNICFCGGEPLLKINAICEYANILKGKKVPNISLVTNGLLVNEVIAQKIFNSGINTVQVSLDGANHISYEKLRQIKGSFDKAINAIKIFKKFPFRSVNVSFCPTSFNIDEIEEVYILCKELGVSLLRTQPLMFLGRANENLKSICPTNEQYRKLLRKIVNINESNKGLKIEWGDPIQHLIEGRTRSKIDNTFITIRANGDIVPSPYLPVVIGNIKKHSFSDYWNNVLSSINIWKIKPLDQIASDISSVPDLNKQNNDIPIVWKEEDIYIDIMKYSNMI